MMTLAHFFLSPRGRITREEFWLGFIAILAISIPPTLLFDPNLGKLGDGPPKPPGLAITLWSLILTWPSAMISIKRFNDRNRPPWVGVLLWLAMATLSIAHYHGLLLDPNQMGNQEKAVFFALLVFFTWALIDNGIFKGTDGPNRYGPDPRQNQPPFPF